MILKQIIAVLLLLLCPQFSPLWSQEEITAEAVLEKYIEAAGGYDAHQLIKNRTINSFIKIEEENRTLNLIIREARPAKSYSLMGAVVGGQLEKGCDGVVAWERDNQGTRLLTGLEKWNVIRNSAFDKYIQWHKSFSRAKYLGKVVLDGKEYFKLSLLPMKLSAQDVVFEEVLFFDIETGLLLRSETRIPSGSGTVPVVTILDDYRDIDGIKLPYKAVISSGGKVREIRILKISHNSAFSNSIFRKSSR